MNIFMRGNMYITVLLLIAVFSIVFLTKAVMLPVLCTLFFIYVIKSEKIKTGKYDIKFIVVYIIMILIYIYMSLNRTCPLY